MAEHSNSRAAYVAAVAARSSRTVPASVRSGSRPVRLLSAVLRLDAAAADASPYGVGMLSAVRHAAVLSDRRAATGHVMGCDASYPWTGNGAAYPSATGVLPVRRPASSGVVAVWRPDVVASGPVRRRLADAVRRAASVRAAQTTDDGRRYVVAVSSSGVAVRLPYDAALRLSSGAAYPVGSAVASWTSSGVTDDDVQRLRDAAARYCRTVDATRSRKRAAEVLDDVAQDAALIFGALLVKAQSWSVAAYADDLDGATSDWQYAATDDLPDCWTAQDAQRAGLQPVAWQYPAAAPDVADDVVVQDDDDDAQDDADAAPVRRRVVTRATLRRWAIHDAARRNGFRLDVAPSDLDATPDAREMRAADRGVVALTSDTRVATLATGSAASWDAVWTPDAYPVLSRLLFHASDAVHSGRASGVWHATTSDVTGTQTRNHRHTARVRDAALAEWSDLRDRLDVVRDATTARHVDI